MEITEEKELEMLKEHERMSGHDVDYYERKAFLDGMRHAYTLPEDELSRKVIEESLYLDKYSIKMGLSLSFIKMRAFRNGLDVVRRQKRGC